MKSSTAIILLAALAGQSVAAPTGHTALSAQQDANALKLLATHLSAGELTQADRVLLGHLLGAVSSLQKRETDAADAADGTFSPLGGSIVGSLEAGVGGLLVGVSDIVTQLLACLFGGDHGGSASVHGSNGSSLNLGGPLGLSVPSTGVNGLNLSGYGLDLGNLHAALNVIFRNFLGGLDDSAISSLIIIITNANGSAHKATDGITQFAASHGLDVSRIFAALQNVISLGNIDFNATNLLKHSGGLLGGLVNALGCLTGTGSLGPIHLTGGVLNGLNTTIGGLSGGVVATAVGNITNITNGGISLFGGLTLVEIQHLIDFIYVATDQLSVTREVQRIAALHGLDAVSIALLLQSLLNGKATPINTGIVPPQLQNVTVGGLTGLLNGTLEGLTGLPCINGTLGGFGLPGFNLTVGGLTVGLPGFNLTVGGSTGGLPGINGTLGGLGGLGGGLGGGSILLGTLVNDVSGLLTFLLHLLGHGGTGGLGGSLGFTSGLLSGIPAVNLTGSLGVAGNVTGTLGSITGGLSGVIGGGTNITSGHLNSTLSGVLSGLGSTVGSIVSGLNSTLSGLTLNLTSGLGSTVGSTVGYLGSALTGTGVPAVGSAVGGIGINLNVTNVTLSIPSGSLSGGLVSGLSGTASTTTALGSVHLNATGSGSIIPGPSLAAGGGYPIPGLGIGSKNVQLSDASDENNTALVSDPSGSDGDDEGSSKSNNKRSHAARFRASVRAANAGIVA